jgi:hypothetical protein
MFAGQKQGKDRDSPERTGEKLFIKALIFWYNRFCIEL